MISVAGQQDDPLSEVQQYHQHLGPIPPPVLLPQIPVNAGLSAQTTHPSSQTPPPQPQQQQQYQPRYPPFNPNTLAIPIPDSLRVKTDSTRIWGCLNDAEADSIGCVEVLATVCSTILMVLTLPISIFLCFKVVQEYERAVIFRLGRLRSGGARGPGVFFVLPCIDNYCKVDLRTVSFDVPPQEVLTRDSVTVSVDAVVYYRIRDPLNAVVQVANYSHSTRLLAATTLRNVLGTRNLSELLTEREAISHSMQVTLDEATDPWGVQVERVEIKDVSLPDSLQRSMAAEAEAAREARAKVIAAEGEMKSSRALKEASDIMCESPAALQLRYLQTLSSIAGEKNSTIVFPLPIELIGPLMNITSSITSKMAANSATSATTVAEPRPSEVID
ncbi:band 7 protein AGAP004871 isoform X1 [Aedes aegypti]|uniref:Band 7 domain-containing protein n=2 Tax=Aedes aegypti TaxID=7159 RepID=A0A6I8TE08_AEDAE|nr:band 7 protein AGAP004871 isoform X1 [Aedes aegypti]